MIYDGYEDAILAIQESEGDDCDGCPCAGIDTCRNQCMENERR